MNIVKTISSVLLAAIIASNAHAQSAKYGPYEENTFMFCRPVGQVKVAAVLLHGGWWRSGTVDNGGAKTTCESLAARGVMIMSINYRLTMPNGSNKSWSWPAQLQDAQRAIRAMRVWMPSIPVGVIGTSAGGHIALMAALDKDTTIWPKTDPMNEVKWPGGVSSSPDFAVDIAGPVDLTNADLWQIAVSNLVDRLPMNPEKARSFASPLMRVDGSAPPVLIMHGENDTVIPFEDVPHFITALNGAGVPNTLLQTPGGHVFQNLSGPQINGYMDKISAWIHAQKRR